jgi:hypothetical protein
LDRRRVASDLFFAAAHDGREFSITVEEDPEQIHDALVAAGGDKPFRLTERRSKQTIYVNPRTIAYWKAEGDGPPATAAAANMWRPR